MASLRPPIDRKPLPLGPQPAQQVPTSMGSLAVPATGPTTFASSDPNAQAPFMPFVPPSTTAFSPAMAFRAAEGQKAIERSAAARGTLLNGGTLKALEGYRQGLASEEFQNDFDRALATFNANQRTQGLNNDMQPQGSLDVTAGAYSSPYSTPGSRPQEPMRGSLAQGTSVQSGPLANYAASVAAARQAANVPYANMAPGRSSLFRDRLVAAPGVRMG